MSCYSPFFTQTDPDIPAYTNTHRNTTQISLKTQYIRNTPVLPRELLYSSCVNLARNRHMHLHTSYILRRVIHTTFTVKHNTMTQTISETNPSPLTPWHWTLKHHWSCHHNNSNGLGGQKWTDTRPKAIKQGQIVTSTTGPDPLCLS